MAKKGHTMIFKANLSKIGRTLKGKLFSLNTLVILLLKVLKISTKKVVSVLFYSSIITTIINQKIER